MTLLIGRRPILTGVAAIGAASLLPQNASAAAVPTLDVASKEGQSTLYRKLAWSLDDRVGFWWLRATRYGVIDAVMTPFWEMYYGMLFAVHTLPGGEYEVTTISASFYTDLATGDYLRKFANPLTGKTVDIGYYPLTPSKSKYNAAGRVPAPAAGGFAVTGTIEPPIVENGQVWLREENRVHGTLPGPNARTVDVNDLSTYYASVQEAADPATPMVLAGQMFSDLLTWPAWLGMGDRPGTFFSRGQGRKVAAIDDMPEKWRMLMQQEHPDIYKDPVAALKG